jgi:hypothetical protein
LGTEGVGESACEVPHAVAALFEFEVAAVVLFRFKLSGRPVVRA